MRWDSDSIKPGMFVISTSGERIGKVIRCDDDHFIVEKGVFFPRDYELRYDHITEVKDGTIAYSMADYLESSRQTGTRPGAAPAPLREAGVAAPAAAAAPATAAAATAARSRRDERAGEELRIPLMEEELGVEKVMRESGHVRIHKAVKSEEKRFAVPTTREEVVIEHVPATNGHRAISGEPAFEEQTLDVTLHEEEVRVSKRPVLREEVVIRTVAQSVETEGSATLRHEEAEIEDTRRTLPSGKQTGDYSGPTGGYSSPGAGRR
jgi:uncharacterized protein (TIGR02271 family)